MLSVSGSRPAVIIKGSNTYEYLRVWNSHNRNIRAIPQLYVSSVFRHFFIPQDMRLRISRKLTLESCGSTIDSSRLDVMCCCHRFD